MDKVKKSIVSVKEKIGYLTFSCSTNVAYNFKSMYYYTFLLMVLKIEPGIAGTMLALGTVWDAINDPLIALYCNNHKFKTGEKIRPYALYACVPWAITIILLFTNFNLDTKVTIVLSVGIYFIFEALYTFLCMPYNSMASLASREDSDRKSINAYRSLGGCIGSGIGAVLTLPIVQMFGGLRDHDILQESDSRALILTAIVMGVICIAGSLFHYFTSKERVHLEGEDEEKLGFIDTYRRLFKCKSWVLNMCYVLCYGIIVACVMQNVNLYASYVLGKTALATPILAVYLVVAILTSIFSPALDKKIGRKATMILAVIVMAVGKIPFIINPFSMASIYCNALTVGFGCTVTFVIFNTNRNNIADILEVQNNRRMDALVAGGDNLITKLAEALAVQIMSIFLARAGYMESLGLNQTPETINTINALLGWIPLIFTLLIIVFALKMDLNKELEESKRGK